MYSFIASEILNVKRKLLFVVIFVLFLNKFYAKLQIIQLFSLITQQN